MSPLKLLTVFFFLFLLTFPVALYADENIIEKDIVYTVVKGDFGETIEGKLGLSWSYIAAANSINPGAPLEIGQKLNLKFARIIPAKLENGIVINIPDRTIYWFVDGKLKGYYFIAAGKPTWQTDTGEFTIKSKVKNPTWHVPPSIQKEMEEAGEDVLIEVPPGDRDNPLGKYMLQLSIKGLGLHSTIAPQSIYKFRSHGCMRLRPEVAELLFREVPVGTKGMIIYEPVKVIKTPDNRILIEVYKDFYKKRINYTDKITARLKELNVLNMVDPNKLKEAIGKKDGLVWDVTLTQ
ncbi:MAG: LysM peptidoglycan-binding domain-containing protein [Nitrospirae bacterium]|nr:MAG: LysM peptidoglycan-binding domain-containing protein [Nitrospirota bacterium]